MASRQVKLIITGIGLSFVLAVAPADAAPAHKHKKHAKIAPTTAAANSKYRGTDLFPAGPVYNANDYLGDDPDPNIRFQIMRDLGVHYGGEP